MGPFIYSQSPKQLHAALASALNQPDAVRSELIHDFHAAMLDTDGLLSPEGKEFTQRDALALSASHRMLLLRAKVDVGTLAFGDYGRNVTSLVKLGLAEEGHDFQGAPVAFLTRSGQLHALALQAYAAELEHGMPFSRHIPSKAPSARAHEQKELWGDPAHAYQGDVVTPDGVQRAWSNRHVALLLEPGNARHNKYLPLNQSSDNAKNILTADIQRVWPKDLEGRARKPITPVAISGTMTAEARLLVDDRTVWFSNGQTANVKLVDAITRFHPDAQWSYDPHQARQGAITISIPDGDKPECKIVGILMGTTTGRFNSTMQPGVADALDAYWSGLGVSPRMAATERAIEESLRALRGHQVSYLPQSDDHSLILRGQWVEHSYAGTYLDLHWDSVDNQHLAEAARHQHVLVVGHSSLASGHPAEVVDKLDAHGLAQRWRDEAFLADIVPNATATGDALRVVDAFGFTTTFDTLASFEKYRRERGLPEWFANCELHELAYRHTSRGSHAFSTETEIHRPPVQLGQRVRWTCNPPEIGVVEGQVTHCEKGQTGAWRLTIRHGKSPTDGLPLNTRVWSNLGTIEDAGWTLTQNEHGRTYLVEPTGQQWDVRSAVELGELTESIARRDPAMFSYMQGLERHWWQTRSMADYSESLDQVLQSQYGIGVEDSQEDAIRLEQERNLGNAPALLATVIADKLNLAPMDALMGPIVTLASMPTVSPGAVEPGLGAMYGRGNGWMGEDAPGMR
jgi:hypothetical protein